MTDYKLKVFDTLKISAQQEIVQGTVWIDGNEYVAIRDRVPGAKDSTGVLFPVSYLERFMEGTLRLAEHLGHAAVSRQIYQHDELPGMGEY